MRKKEHAIQRNWKMLQNESKWKTNVRSEAAAAKEKPSSDPSFIYVYVCVSICECMWVCKCVCGICICKCCVRLTSKSCSINICQAAKRVKRRRTEQQTDKSRARETERERDRDWEREAAHAGRWSKGRIKSAAAKSKLKLNPKTVGRANELCWANTLSSSSFVGEMEAGEWRGVGLWQCLHLHLGTLSDLWNIHSFTTPNRELTHVLRLRLRLQLASRASNSIYERPVCALIVRSWINWLQQCGGSGQRDRETKGERETEREWEWQEGIVQGFAYIKSVSLTYH